VPRERTGHSDLAARLEQLRRDAIARELRNAVRFAHVLMRPAVLVDRVDVNVAMRVLRLELCERAVDAYRFARIEVRGEAVMRERVGSDQQGADCDGGGGSKSHTGSIRLAQGQRAKVKSEVKKCQDKSANAR